MDIFLLHCLLLAWLSLGAGRQLAAHTADRIVAAALLAWGNLIVTSLLLSLVQRLGDQGWFLGTSTLLAAITCLCLRRRCPAPASNTSRPNGWLLVLFVLTLAPIAGACFWIAYAYVPGNPDSLTYHLPRAMYYLGQGSLVHFDAADLRQTQLPFNADLLSLFALIHGAPLQSLNFFTLLSWGLLGLAIYRVCLLQGASANAALIASWLSLVTTGVLAQAGSTTPELPVCVGLLGALLFFLQWQQDRRTENAMLAGLAVGLATGSDFRVATLVFAVAILSAWSLTRQKPETRPALRAWLLPTLLITAIGLPFFFINLMNGTPGFGLLCDRLIADSASAFRTGWMPLRPLPTPVAELSDDTAGFGLVGPLFLICASLCIPRAGKNPRWLAGLVFAWIVAVFLFHRLSLHPRDFIPALLLASPCFALVISAASWQRWSGRAALALIAMITIWSAGVYLLKNSRLPLEALRHTSFVRPGMPALPLLIEHRMTKQPWVNIETDGPGEKIFPFMVHGRKQRFTSHRSIQPGAYNLFSRAASTRNAAYTIADQSPAYVTVAVENKRTAGVEFLATIGQGMFARDYFGLEPDAGQTSPIPSNRNLLVTVYREPNGDANQPNTFIRVNGLNPEDKIRLAVEMRMPEGKLIPVASFDASDKKSVRIEIPFQSLVFRALAAENGTEMGSAAIPYRYAASANSTPADTNQPSDARPIFLTDLVLSKDPTVVRSEGLLPVEGPFPQWDIPYIRWAREPVVRLKIPSIAHFSRLQFSFSFRLHVRKQGKVNLFFNGILVKRYDLEGPLNWIDETLNLTPLAGDNVIEFRDATYKIGPDWQDYLERYPGIKDYLISQNVPLEAGAQEHYELHGRAEGRTVTQHETQELEPAYESYYFMFRNLRLEGFASP